jgi:hypothetical protein
MKIFLLPFYFLAFVFSSDFDIPLDNLTYSFSEVKAKYLKYKNDPSYFDQFICSHHHLTEFLKESYETDAVELFQRIEERKDPYLAHCVLGIIDALIRNCESTSIWKDHVEDINADLFYRAKNLMKVMVKKQNWANSKKILHRLLLIQKRFLLLFGDGWEIQKVQKRLMKYEFIHDNFNPGDKDAFLNLFHHLSLLDHRGKVTKDSLLGKLIKLFKVYRSHFLSYDREQFGEIPTFPLKFLYSIVTATIVSYSKFINILNNQFPLSLNPLLKIPCLKKAFQIYRGLTESAEFFTVEISSDFIVFIRESIDDSGNNTFNLMKESDIWLLEAILFLIPKTIS